MEYQYGDGSKKLMAFRGNLEPVQVCPKGQLCEKISAIPQTQSGNPLIYSSEYNNNLRGLQIAGNTEQKSYEGKNLFDINNALIGSNWYYIGGTISYPLNLTVGNQYTISANTLVLKNDANYNCDLVRKTGDTVFSATKLFVMTNSLGKKEYTFTADGTEYLWGYRDGMTGSTAIQNYINDMLLEYVENIQIEQGSTATEYEPYVGGVPSPNPQYPQPIINTGDNGLTLSLLGGNLVNLSNISTVGQGSLSFVNSGFALLSSLGGSCRWYIPITTEQGKKYTLSVGSVRALGNGNTAPNYIYIGTTNEATEQGVGVLDTTTSNTITFTAPGGTVYIKGTATAGGIGTGVNIQQLMVLEGEYTEQNIPPYEVYDPQKVAQSVTIDELTLSKIGTVADLLIVDKKINLAYKSQRFATVNLADCYVQGSAYLDGSSTNDLIFNLNLPLPSVGAPYLLCTHFLVHDQQSIPKSNTIVVFGSVSDIANCTLTVEEFEALVNSRAVLVTYLTNTTTNIGLDPDIRPQVLGLSPLKGNTILSVTSELPPSNVTADYYIWGGRE